MPPLNSSPFCKGNIFFLSPCAFTSHDPLQPRLALWPIVTPESGDGSLLLWVIVVWAKDVGSVLFASYLEQGYWRQHFVVFINQLDAAWHCGCEEEEFNGVFNPIGCSPALHLYRGQGDRLTAMCHQNYIFFNKLMFFLKKWKICVCVYARMCVQVHVWYTHV